MLAGTIGSLNVSGKRNRCHSTPESWLRENENGLPRHSELAKGVQRTPPEPVGRPLTYHAENGWAEADNNIAENALVMVSLGRKNWLFFGSDHGGESGERCC